uniref:Wsv161-like protein n=1 Tax=Sicyonia whispovirus TaxID=2984283 RepID=A0A9C7BRA9_9VIRU|nr:MAG: wsv161-like protein [Sicyonia whispovirus]
MVSKRPPKVIKRMLNNMKFKKEHAKNARRLSGMGYAAAAARAPASSQSRLRRNEKKRKGEENGPRPDGIIENLTADDDHFDYKGKEGEDPAPDSASVSVPKPGADHAPDPDHPAEVPPSKVAAIKRAIAGNLGTKKTRRVTRGRIKSEDVFWADSLVDGDTPCASFSEYCSSEDLWREKMAEHRMRGAIADLDKSRRVRQLPLASSLVMPSIRGRGSTRPPKGLAVGTPLYINAGATIARVCLSQPYWALISRNDSRSGAAEWERASRRLLASLARSDVADSNLVLGEAARAMVNASLKERACFEILADECCRLFSTEVLQNKIFDRAFQTVASENTDARVRSMTVAGYFRALNEKVWRRLAETIDMLVSGGAVGGGRQTAASRLEACADSVVARAKSRPVDAVIKKAVERARSAYGLSVGAFIPKDKQKQTQQQQLYPAALYTPTALPLPLPPGVPNPHNTHFFAYPQAPYYYPPNVGTGLGYGYNYGYGNPLCPEFDYRTNLGSNCQPGSQLATMRVAEQDYAEEPAATEGARARSEEDACSPLPAQHSMAEGDNDVGTAAVTAKAPLLDDIRPAETADYASLAATPRITAPAAEPEEGRALNLRAELAKLGEEDLYSASLLEQLTGPNPYYETVWSVDGDELSGVSDFADRDDLETVDVFP